MVEFLIKMAVILCSLYQTSNAGSAFNSSTGDGLACPTVSVVFTCSVNRSAILWEVDPPPGVVTEQLTLIVSSATTELVPLGVEGFMFEAARTEFSSNSITSTLTTVTEVSLLNGTVVRCIGAAESLTIIVAEQPTSPSAPTIISQQNQPSSSIITLEWDPPSSTGGVSVSYVLTISPAPLPGSLATVETTSTQITLSYNTPYNVSIRADNCAGSSSDVMVTIPSIVTCLSNPTPANRVTIIDAPPLPALEGSTLSFTCNGQTVSTNCESDGQWSPNPTTYNCSSVVTCGSPAVPSRGSVDFKGQTSPFLIDSVVNFRCDKGLFPAGDMPSTCENMGGVGTWKPDTNIVCRDKPINCTVPEDPSNATIVDYERLNETVLEGTVLTYQCDNGLSLSGPNTITCTNAGVWSTEPGTITCVPTTTMPAPSIGPIVGGVVGGILVVVCLVVIVVIVLLLMRRWKADELNEDVVEMSGLQGDYSELRHDGPRNAKKAQPPPPDSEGYSRVNRSPDAGALTYDEVVLNSDNKIGVNSEGYSTMNTGQTQRLPGYGQLGNVATVEPVVYAALSSSQPRKKGKNTTTTVDQHQVTYATVDVAATSRKQAKAATLPTSPTASAPALPDVDKLLDIDQALVQIRSMEHKWRELAETMRVPETMIEQIEDSCGINHSGCLTEVIDQWMRNCSGRPTWRELAGHLHNIGEEQLSQELLNIYNTGRLPVELNMKAVPSTVYKYDRAPPPPLPSRSPTMTDDSPGQSKTLPPSRPPKVEMTPVRPPKPIPKDESPLPPRPPKHYAKH